MGPQAPIAPYRVVLDTNVAVSALLFRRGRLEWLRLLWQRGTILPLMDRDCGAELLRVLRYPKFRLAATEISELLGDLLPYCETVTVDPHTHVVPLCRDRDDEKFMRLALAGGALAIVTGDKNLHELAGTFALPIVKPVEFQAWISQR